MPGPDLPSPTLWAVAPALSLPSAPELAWLHTQHHLTLPYLCLGGATPSRFLHELEDPCELCPIPCPATLAAPHTPPVCSSSEAGLKDSLRPWPVTCSQEPNRESGVHHPPGGV